MSVYIERLIRRACELAGEIVERGDAEPCVVFYARPGDLWVAQVTIDPGLLPHPLDCLVDHLESDGTTIELALSDLLGRLGTAKESKTAPCEACGCTFRTPCKGGCAWRLEYLERGRFVCSRPACARKRPLKRKRKP